MDTDAGKPLVLPAWCDPESRNYRLSWEDILIGLLTVDDERLVFATPSGVVFNAVRSESTLEWRRDKGFGLVPRFDLFIPQGSFRLYLSRPSTTAPLYDPGIVADVGEQLSLAGDVLGALVSNLFQIVGGVGELMTVPGDVRELRQGRVAANALRARLSSPPRERPSARSVSSIGGLKEPRLVFTHVMERSWAESLAFNPDASLLAVGQSNGAVKIWHFDSRRPTRHLMHDLRRGAVNGVAFSDDGSLVASVGDDRMLKIHSLTTGKHLVKRRHPDDVHAVSFGRGSELVVTTCSDGIVRVWTGHGEPWMQIKDGCTALTSHLNFGPDGNTVGTAEPFPRIWDVSRRCVVREIRGTNATFGVLHQADEPRIAMLGIAGVEVFNLVLDRTELSVPFEGYYVSDFASTGNRLVTSDDTSNTTNVWDCESGDRIADIAHESGAHVVALAQGGRFLATATISVVQVWELPSS